MENKVKCETLTVSCGVVGLILCVDGVLWCVICELPTASLASQAQVYCGY